jgi:hypothetical protein
MQAGWLQKSSHLVHHGFMFQRFFTIFLGGEFLLFLENIFACKMCLSPKMCHFCENLKNWVKKKGKKVVAPTIIALCAGLIGKLGLPLKSVCYLCWLLFDVQLRFILFFGLSIVLL